MTNVPRALVDRREVRHFHLFCGLGGGACGFNRGSARVGNMVADFRCIGGIVALSVRQPDWTDAVPT